jgi:hypothetical protein
VSYVFDPSIGEPGDRVRYHSTVLGTITDTIPASRTLRRVRLDDGQELWLDVSQFVLVQRGRAA